MFKKIYIEITNMCNLKCKFCPETIRKKEFMPIGNFERIIEKIYRYTNLVCLHVKGEPLLHKDLLNILQILEKYDLKANITTNGTLLENNIQTLNMTKSVRQINISVHSMTQSNMLGKEYLRTIFKSVKELKDIIISYRLWNITDLKENSINTDIIAELENYYKIPNLKEELKKNLFLKLKDNVFINQDIEFTWPNINSDKIIKKR